MKFRLFRFLVLPGLALLAAPWAFLRAAAQFPPQIKNIVVIFQENRTPDNLFHFLTPACPLRGDRSGPIACIPFDVNSSCYDISPCGLSNQNGAAKPRMLKPAPLAGAVDPAHSHQAFMAMCDPDPITLACRNDGAWHTARPAGASYAYVDNAAVTNSDGSQGGLLDPYLTLAKQYGWANFMYQTNQGPSYPAHQFMFSGTSALTADADAKATFVAENFDKETVSQFAGCLAKAGATNALVSPALSTPPADCDLYVNGTAQECTISNTALIYPTNPVGTFCASHASIADILDPAAVSWKYYAPSAGLIWTAPDAIKSICEPAFVDPNGNPNAGLKCTGREWHANVDIANLGTDILRDIAGCNLSRVSWVIPDGRWSDHAGLDDLYGPSWVAAVVNAIGNRSKCADGSRNAGETFWQDTAIIVTWDDWGGWSDNQPPPFVSKLPCRSTGCQGDYQYGFRVPLLMVSAYTPAGFISNTQHDFGSVLRMIEGVNHLREGQLGFADARATTDLSEFFTLEQPRDYQTVPAVKDASFFLGFKGKAIDPDDD